MVQKVSCGHSLMNLSLACVPSGNDEGLPKVSLKMLFCYINVSPKECVIDCKLLREKESCLRTCGKMERKEDFGIRTMYMGI